MIVKPGRNDQQTDKPTDRLTYRCMDASQNVYLFGRQNRKKILAIELCVRMLDWCLPDCAFCVRRQLVYHADPKAFNPSATLPCAEETHDVLWGSVLNSKAYPTIYIFNFWRVAYSSVEITEKNKTYRAFLIVFMNTISGWFAQTKTICLHLLEVRKRSI